MQTRIAFNSGEFSPEMAVRADIEPYARGCDELLNWEVGQAGGIKRRKGMKVFAEALSEDSKLVPYIYSYTDSVKQRYLVEIGRKTVKIYSPYEETALVKTLEVPDEGEYEPRDCRICQINKMLFITEKNNPVRVLEYDGSDWTLKAFEFKYLPYRYNHEDRDEAITLTVNGSSVTVDFSGVTEEGEGLPSTDDVLMASFTIEQREIFQTREDVLHTDGSFPGTKVWPYFWSTNSAN